MAERKAGLWRIAAILLLSLVAGGLSFAQAPPTADMVKAAYLYKFSRFVEWPETGAGAEPLVIGVLGDESVARELERIAAANQGGGRAVVVRRIAAEDDPAGVQILFLGQARSALSGQILERVKGRPILTVTDADESFDKGAMIEFVLIDDRMRFIVATRPVGASALKISALMLAAAYKVLANPS